MVPQNNLSVRLPSSSAYFRHRCIVLKLKNYMIINLNEDYILKDDVFIGK